MRVEERSLSEDQVERLAMLVRSGLAKIGDSRMQPPLPSDYIVERDWMPRSGYEFTLDIDIGTTILTLRRESSWTGRTFGPATDLNELCETILQHVILARNDKAGAALLRLYEKTCRAAIEHNRLPMKFISTRFCATDIGYLETEAHRPVSIRVELLDDTLRPYTQIIDGRGPRATCRRLNAIGQKQNKRKAKLERLALIDAVLEIESMAEYAISAAGRSVGEVAQEILQSRDSPDGVGHSVQLWKARNGNHIDVVAREGRICLEALLRPLSWSYHDGITVQQNFPDAVTIGLAGKPLSTLVEHPLLKGTVLIAEAFPRQCGRTEIQFATSQRPIYREEMGPTYAGQRFALSCGAPTR